MNKITTPFTYLIGWSKLNKFYYGVRYAQGCDPSDLWTSYFTSSGPVSRFRTEHGDPDVVQVRYTFNSTQAARDWELKVLKRMNVVLREDFLNQHDRPTPSCKGMKFPNRSREHTEKLTTWWKDPVKKATACEKMRINGKGKNAGRVVLPEVGAKISAAKKGVLFSAEHEAALSVAAIARASTPEGKAHLSANGSKSAGRLHRDESKKSIGEGLKKYHAARRAARDIKQPA
jgi:hypothetical protein